MGLMSKVAIIVMLGGLRHPGKHRAQSRAARARAKAERAGEEKARVETEVGQEQDAAIARAKQEDDARAQEDLEEVAEEEAEAVPWNRPADPPGQELASARHGPGRHAVPERPAQVSREPARVGPCFPRAVPLHAAPLGLPASPATASACAGLASPPQPA